MSKISSPLTLFLAIFLIFVSIRSASPPAVKTGDISDTSFSVKKAFTNLSEISRMPHSTGTPENTRVQKYLAATCQQLGFMVEIQNTTAVNNDRERVTAANVYNIIAQKKGQHNSKAVVLMAHYDSQPNTPGAGDDGAGVAAMLETARALQKTAPLQNDLILLFTAGEEIGMMGANAFMKESPLVKQIGLVINFEGRGNAGPSNMFEVNDKNGWVINEYAKSVAHPFANSLGYEIYKKLPNYTDYTLFKNAGITGLNNAYIDGFVNYHSPNDKPETMNLRSLQHHGDNMLSLAKHFGNLTIANTKAPDLSYFNVIGNWFVHYPAAWNLIFVFITDVLFIFFLVAGFGNKKISAVGFIVSSLVFPVVLAIIYFAAKYLLKFILFHYPLYSHFYENNSYNSAWYFLAMTALAVTLFSFIYYLVAKKVSSNSLLAGILLIVVILMNGMQYAIPSASYLLFIPVFFMAAGRIFMFVRKEKQGQQSIQSDLLNLACVLPVICLLAPIIYFTFIAFALGNNMPFVVVAEGMCIGLLLPVLSGVLKDQKLLIPIIAFLCFLGAMTGGHFTSGYSQKHPLQSSLRYLLDADSAKAKWISDFHASDKWTSGFFKNVPHHYADLYRNTLINDAPVLPLLPPAAIVTKDTIHRGNRILTVHFNTQREKAYYIGITIADSSKVNTLFINGKEARITEDGKPSWYRSIGYTGVTNTGFDVIFQMQGNNKLDIFVSDRSIGLPSIPGFNTTHPLDIIPAPGAFSNTMLVKKHFVF